MRSLLFLLFIFLLSCKQSFITLPMSQGFTTKKATQIAVLVNKKTQYQYFVFEPSQLSLLKTVGKAWSDLDQKEILKGINSKVSISVAKKVTRSFSDKAVETLFIKGLDLGKIYSLFVVGKKKCTDKHCIKKCGKFCNVLIDKREFKSLNTDKKEVKMAVASCSATYLYDVQRRIWTEILQKKPDVVLLLGDNVYVDRYINGRSVSTKKDFWIRYTEMRKSLNLYKTKTLVPIFAIWDDHDYGINDGDKNFLWKKESKKVFQTFFAQKPMGSVFEKGPGVSFVVKAFGQRLFFMDNRSFRTPNKNDKRNKLKFKKVEYETHWGKKQESWLFSQLQTSVTPSWLIDGGQFFGGYLPWESYEASHPNNFKNVFIKNIKKSKAAVAFLSGDRHFFEFSKISKAELGFTSYEVTSSGVHTRLYPALWVKYYNKRQIFGKAMFYNYAILNSKLIESQGKSALAINLEAWGLGYKLAYRKNFKVIK